MSEPILKRDEKGLYLTDGSLVLRADFCEMKDRIRQANLERELLVKAVSVKGSRGSLKVLDATAGLGEDAFLLAAAGFDVSMYEQDEVIAALLEDALNRALEADNEECTEAVRDAASRLHLTKGDSIEAMRSMAGQTCKVAKADLISGLENNIHSCSTPVRPFDVIYLDPMFPGRKKSAAVKKKFQLLQLLECPEMREDELLEAAISLHPLKVVIKRPVKGPFLSDIKPDHSVKGNSVRYDVVIPRIYM